MDFSGLNSNPVVFDTSANVRPALALEDEDDAITDEVPCLCAVLCQQQQVSIHFAHHCCCS